MERDGVLIIRRFSGPTYEERCMYVVIFGADDLAAGGVPRTLCRGDEQLRALLEALRIRDVLHLLEEAQQGGYTGRRVRVTSDRLHGVGLVAARSNGEGRREGVAA